MGCKDQLRTYIDPINPNKPSQTMKKSECPN